ncbi:MAG: hypothetical protein D6769_01075 [Methanobacteriota archaeon]|nr:MAG: hypothetical protein D6769_01075 [Euryarchaeota archaeon]
MKKRIRSLDFLRGVAIIIMFIDHFAGIALLDPINPTTIRFLTRLAEPLFALLFGYFLHSRSKDKLVKRGIEVTAVAILVNLFYYSLIGRFEILGSFVLMVVAYFFLGNIIKWLLPLALLTPWDPTIAFLDYPITLVASQAALGMLMREGKDWRLSLFFIIPFLLMRPPWSYSFLFMPLATYMLAWAVKNKGYGNSFVEILGRYPLMSYVMQFIAAVALSAIYYALFTSYVPTVTVVR